MYWKWTILKMNNFTFEVTQKYSLVHPITLAPKSSSLGSLLESAMWTIMYIQIVYWKIMQIMIRENFLHRWSKSFVLSWCLRVGCSHKNVPSTGSTLLRSSFVLFLFIQWGLPIGMLRALLPILQRAAFFSDLGDKRMGQ